MRINVCFASDNNYVQHMGAAIASILKNAKAEDDLYFYILDGGISEENINKVQFLKKIKNCEINFVKMNNETFKNLSLYEESHITIATYYRFMIASLLPEVDKLIYLDCDMIILDSLSELFETDIKDYWIAGVEDIGYYHFRIQSGRDTESFYINAGMILINLKKWREDNIQDKLFRYAIDNKETLVHNDQDAINMVLKEKIKPLNVKWNAQDLCFHKNTWRTHPRGEKIKEAGLNPVIIHYLGEEKPWNNFLIVNKGFEYRKYKKLTQWADETPSDIKIVIEIVKSILKKYIKNPFFLVSSDFMKKNKMEKRNFLLSGANFSNN